MFLVIFFILLTQLYSIKGELIKDASLKPAEPFDVRADAETISKTIYEIDHKDRDKIANIIFHRTLDQRQKIAELYDREYSGHASWCGANFHTKPLSKDLSEISKGSLDKLYKMMFTGFDALLGRTLYKGVTGDWKEEGVVEEIACANDKEMKDVIQTYFKSTYICSVEEHLNILHRNNPAYQEAMHKYCWPQRCQENKIKPEDVDKEAKALQEIDPKTDKEGFKKKLKEHFDKYCEPDLKQIFNKYKKGDHRISDGVDEAFEGDEKTLFNVLVRYIENTCMYYADELYHAMHGAGTDIDKINRIVVTRSERDMACIFKEYQKKRGETFTERLKKDTISEPRYLECIRYLCGKP